MPEKKKRLAKVEIVLADDKPRELLYTLEEIHELSELRKTADATDPRNFARIMQLGLRHAEPDLTVEQVSRLIDAPNFDYYNQCVADAAGTGQNPIQPQRVNGAPIGENSGPLPVSSLELAKGNFGN